MPEPERELPLFTKKSWAAGAILSAIILGAIGSGVWDLFAKPGLSSLGRFFLTLFTLGSQAAKDAAYSTAALDPTALPSLLILIYLCYIPFIVATSVAMFEFFVPFFLRRNMRVFRKQERQRRKETMIEAGRHARNLRIKQFMKRRRRFFAIFSIVAFTVCFLWMEGQVLIFNQAVLIYRVFNANMAICAPFLSGAEEKQLRSKFAAIRGKADYLIIDKELKGIAEQNGVSLTNIELW